MKINKSYLSLLINFAFVVALYALYLYMVSLITPVDLTDFYSPLQWGGSLIYISYVVAVVILISQVIIILLKKLAFFLGLDLL
jgi:hypothetical protein